MNETDRDVLQLYSSIQRRGDNVFFTHHVAPS